SQTVELALDEIAIGLHVVHDENGGPMLRIQAFHCVVLALSNRRMRARSVAGSSGLVSRSSNPASRMAASWSGIAEAVTATIGVSSPAARSCRQTASPRRSGSRMSRAMRSNGSARARARPAAPDVSSATVCPSGSSTARKSSALSTSSSTCRIRMHPPRGSRRPCKPGAQARGVQRLRDEVVDVQARRARVLDGDDHDGDAHRLRSQSGEDSLAPSIGKPKVEHDAQGQLACDGGERASHGRGHFDEEALLPGQRGHQARIALLVVNDEQPSAVLGDDDHARQTDTDGGAATDHALKVDRSSLELDEPLHEREPETRTGRNGAARKRAVEWRKDSLEVFLPYPDAAVSDLEHERRLLDRHAERDPPSL